MYFTGLLTPCHITFCRWTRLHIVVLKVSFYSFCDFDWPIKSPFVRDGCASHSSSQANNSLGSVKVVISLLNVLHYYIMGWSLTWLRYSCYMQDTLWKHIVKRNVLWQKYQLYMYIIKWPIERTLWKLLLQLFVYDDATCRRPLTMKPRHSLYTRLHVLSFPAGRSWRTWCIYFKLVEN